MNLTLNRRASRLACALLLGATGTAHCSAGAQPPAAAPAGALPDIVMDGTNLYPESMSSAPDGSVYIGSMKGIVFGPSRARTRQPPGSNRRRANGILTLLGRARRCTRPTHWAVFSPRRATARHPSPARHH